MMATSGLGGLELARDALGELINVGTGRALVPLEWMIGRSRCKLSLPRIGGPALARELPEMNEMGMVIRLDVPGYPYVFLAFFGESSALGWAAALTGKAPESVTALGPLEESALKELINITGCAFLEQVGVLLREPLVPSPPLAQRGLMGTLLATHLAPLDAPLIVTNEFSDVDRGCSGRFALLLDARAVAHVLSTMGIAATREDIAELG